MANSRPTLYTGVTNGLVRRVYEHKHDLVKGFASKYKLHNLVYYETLGTIVQAIIREKQIKDMNRNEKLVMIGRFNPTGKDLHRTILDSPPDGGSPE